MSITLRDAMLEEMKKYFQQDIENLGQNVNALLIAEKNKKVSKEQVEKQQKFLTGRRNIANNFILFINREFSEEYVEDENRRAISLGRESGTSEDEGSGTEELPESEN
jgi:hypothetical protein